LSSSSRPLIITVLTCFGVTSSSSSDAKELRSELEADGDFSCSCSIVRNPWMDSLSAQSCESNDRSSCRRPNCKWKQKTKILVAGNVIFSPHGTPANFLTKTELKRWRWPHAEEAIIVDHVRPQPTDEFHPANVILNRNSLISLRIQPDHYPRSEAFAIIIYVTLSADFMTLPVGL
jgi:hypothetical protein